MVVANISKKIDVPITVTLGQLRKKAADIFGFPFNGFQLAGKTRTFSPEDDDTQLREAGWQDPLYVVRNGSTTDAGNFKALLAQNQAYIGHLFLLLSKESAPYVDSVWELLMLLPPNQKMKSDLETLNLPTTGSEGWNSLLDSGSVHKFFYSLRIVEKLMTPEEPQTTEPKGKNKWLEQFAKKGGVAHLFSALLALPIASIHHPLTRKCFALLMKLLAHLETQDPDFAKAVPDYEKQRDRTTERVLTILYAFAHYSILTNGDRDVNSPRKEKPQQIYKTKDDPPKPEETKTESQTLVRRRSKQVEESHAFDSGFQLIQGRDSHTYNYFEQVARFADLRSLLLKGLIQTDNRFLQHRFTTQLFDICKAFRDVPYSATHPHVVLLPLMLQQLIHETLEPETRCGQFYKLLCNLLDSIPRQRLETLPVNYPELFRDTSELVKAHEVRENTSTDTDSALIGMMNLLEVLLKKFPGQKRVIGQEFAIVRELLLCLFEFPQAGGNTRGAKGLPPKCKSQTARQSAFNLLCTLARDCPENLRQVIDFLLPIHMYIASFSSHR